jgi:hypothetical protein
MGNLPYIYTVNLDTGGQTSLYEFEFRHSCAANVGGKVLIGGRDGHLYELDRSNTSFIDDETDFADNCYMRTSFEDWDLPANWKHNKAIILKMTGDIDTTANLRIYKNDNFVDSTAIPISFSTSPWGEIFSYSALEIYDANVEIGITSQTIQHHKKKFNYRTVMLGVENITGDIDISIEKIDLKTAIMGVK